MIASGIFLLQVRREPRGFLLTDDFGTATIEGEILIGFSAKQLNNTTPGSRLVEELDLTCGYGSVGFCCFYPLTTTSAPCKLDIAR